MLSEVTVHTVHVKKQVWIIGRTPALQRPGQLCVPAQRPVPRDGLRALVWQPFLELLQNQGHHLVPSRGRRSVTKHPEICPVSLPVALRVRFHCKAVSYVWKISQS